MSAKPSLVRHVWNATFTDPFTAQVVSELTYQNESAEPIELIEISKAIQPVQDYAPGQPAPGQPLFSNLRFYSSERSRLELLQSGAGELGVLRIKLPQSMREGEQRTIYMEHTYAFEPERTQGSPHLLSVVPRLLFEEPEYVTVFVLPDSGSTYVFIQPAPKLSLEIDKDRSIIPESSEENGLAQVIAHPPLRNAIYVRYGPYPRETSGVTLMLSEYWKNRGFILAPDEFPRTRIQRVNTRPLKWVEGFARRTEGFDLLLSFLLSRLRRKRVRFSLLRILHQKYEKRVEERSKPLLEARTVISFRQTLPKGLKRWIYAVLLVGFATGLVSPEVTIDAPVVALLAVTRSWLFYEERMMKRAGYAILIAVVLNTLSMLLASHYQESLLSLLSGLVREILNKL